MSHDWLPSRLRRRRRAEGALVREVKPADAEAGLDPTAAERWENQSSADFSPLWAGQAAALGREEDAGALTEWLWREAKARLVELRLER